MVYNSLYINQKLTLFFDSLASDLTQNQVLYAMNGNAVAIKKGRMRRNGKYYATKSIVNPCCIRTEIQ